MLLPPFQLRAIAVSQADEATWWVNLYKANNGKSFCVPPDKTLLDMAKAVQKYIQSNNLPDSITDPQAIQILAQIYPCGGIKKADLTEKANIKKVINDPTLLQSVINTAKKSAVIINNPCPSAKFSLNDKLAIYKPLIFDEAGTITGGAWKYVVQEEGCGATRTLNVLSIIANPKSLSTTPLLPGTTHADPLLQKDAVRYAVIATGGPEKNCKTGYIEQTEFLKYEGAPLEGAKGAPWQELWTITSCTQKAQVIVHFIPDKTGTSITTNLTETKFIPIEHVSGNK
jgi:hypothetical protein